MQGITKYDQFRLKTDQQLVRLVQRELAAGCDRAHQALATIESLFALEACYRRAVKAHNEVCILVPLIKELPSAERHKLHDKLESLAAMIHGLSAVCSTSYPTEEKFAALARSLFEDRSFTAAAAGHGDTRELIRAS